MTAAAMTGPTPNKPVRLVPVGLDRGGERLPGLADLGVDAAQVLDERGGELAAGRIHGPCGRDRVQQPGGGRRGDRLRDPAGDQLAQHRMQPAHHLGTGPAQVTVPFGPHLQHRRVIIGHGLPDTRRAQRRDGHRPGVIRVVLVRVAGGQQPHPRAELRLDIQHPLSCGQELLGQQVTQAAGALDRPGPLRPGRSPGQQLLRLAALARTRSSPSGFFGSADHHRRVRGLVRIDPDHHCRHGRTSYLDTATEARGRARLIPKELAGARASFEPRHGEAPASRHVVRKPDPRQGPAGG